VDLGAVLTISEGENVTFEESIIGENPIQEISKLLSWHDRDRDDDILETLDNFLYDEYLREYDPDNPENWETKKEVPSFSDVPKKELEEFVNTLSFADDIFRLVNNEERDLPDAIDTYFNRNPFWQKRTMLEWADWCNKFITK